MSEAALWSRTRTHLGPHGRLVRVENRVDDGTPDVNYLLRRYPTVEAVCGWLELKHETAWPVRERTTFTIGSLNLDQVNWQTFWAMAGGRVWTLLQVADDLLLLDHRTLAQVWAKEHRKRSLLASATLVSARTFPTAGLIKCLTST